MEIVLLLDKTTNDKEITITVRNNTITVKEVTEANEIKTNYVPKGGRGRPRIDYPDNWVEVYNKWKKNKITATKAMELLGLKRNTFYKLAAKYEAKTNESIETKESTIC